MIKFDKQEFSSIHDRGNGKIFTDMEFLKCSFKSCSLSITQDVRKRTTVRNVKIINCHSITCAIDAAIIEDVLVDGLNTHRDLLQAFGAVFKHVELKNKIGRIMISPYIFDGLTNKKKQKPFTEANNTYYSTIDWALDISNAEFEECDIRGIPARLIRRDPETQVVVTREKALQGEWKKLNLSKTYWPTAIEFMLDRSDPDVVLVAPKRDLKFWDLLQGLKLLREAGIAEPD